MQIDPTKTLNSIEKLIEHNWETEMNAFIKKYELSGIPSNDTLGTWIKLCEIKGWTDDIFYHLMVLKLHFLNK